MQRRDTTGHGIAGLAAAAVLGLAAAITTPDGVWAQGMSAYARVQSDIRRYGCHLPQYATATEICRQLHARARDLERQQLGAYRAARGQASQLGAYQPDTRHWSTPPQQRPRGLFGFLFGDPSGPVRPYSGEQRYDDDYGFPRASYATYRTLCVRLCDGYYWPISHATTRARFSADSQRCESSCNAPAKLFIHRTGADVEQMTDLAGKAYATLATAFLYRKEYIADCRCKPDPWTAEAQAEYAARGTDSPVAAAEEATPELDGERQAVLAEAEPASRAEPAASRRWTASPGNAPRYDTARPQRGWQAPPEAGQQGWRFPFFSFR